MHGSNRAVIYRAENAGLSYIDRVRSNLYRVYPTKMSAEIDGLVPDVAPMLRQPPEPGLVNEAWLTAPVALGTVLTS